MAVALSGMRFNLVAEYCVASMFMVVDIADDLNDFCVDDVRHVLEAYKLIGNSDLT